jgi:hypothetical protein
LGLAAVLWAASFATARTPPQRQPDDEGPTLSVITSTSVDVGYDGREMKSSKKKTTKK